MKLKFFHASLSFVTIMALSVFTTTAHGQESSKTSTETPSAPPVSTSAKPNSSDANIPITLKLEYATIAKTTAELGKKYRLNIVTDAHPDDNAENISMDNVPLGEALRQIAQAYGREIHIVNRIIVFRVPNWFMPKDNEGLLLGYTTRWTQEGSVEAQYPILANTRVQLPLKVSATNASLHQILRKFAEATDWTISVPPARRNDRLNATITGVTPGQFAEALTFLLNARQQITISQTPEQRDLEKKLAAAGEYDQKDEREKRSDVLRTELTPLLTKEQKDAIADGKEVALQISSLPESVQKDAISYVNYVCDQISQNNSDVSLARDRVKEFSVVFMPLFNAPGGAFGVNGFNADGGLINF